MRKSTINIRVLVLILLILNFGVNNIFSQDEKALPAPINTIKFTEYAPSISADGKTLVFQSDRQGDWKLFESRRNGKNWSVPTTIPKITTTFFEKAPLGGPCLSYDGNLLFFSANGKDSDGHEDIYYSFREKNRWSAPMNLGRPVNSGDDEGYPSLSPDGNFLYFARAKYISGDNKESQQRCYRIMRSEREKDGKWQTAIELPNPVNLTCEKAPRIMPDGKTLMFSSIRKDGKGNFDIYQCQLQENGTWSNPKALDLLNTTGSDQFVAVPACGEMIYYAKDGDLYTANIPTESLATVQGFVSDSTSNNPISTKILVSEVTNPNNVIARITSAPLDGRYSAVLRFNGKYVFEIIQSGYANKKVVVDLSQKQDCDSFEQNFKLTPLFRKETSGEEMFKLSFLAIDSQTDLIVPANFEAKEVSSGQLVSLKFNPNTLQNQGEFRYKQNYIIEASIKGYKNSNLSIRKDEKSELLPVSIIKLTPISTNFIIKAYDDANNVLLKDTKATITDVTTGQMVELNANPQTGECEANLLNGQQYKIVVSSALFENSEQKIIKTDTFKDLTVKLFPKKPYTVNLLALDLENEEPIEASFTVLSEKTGKVFKGNKIKAKTYFPVNIYQNDNLKVEVTSEGFTTGKVLVEITNIKLGEHNQYNIKLPIDRYPIIIKVVDAETQKPIKEAEVTLIDLKTSEAIKASKSKTNDFTAQIKRLGLYELNIKAEDYVVLSNQRIDKAPAGGVVNFMLLRKKRLPVHFAFFDILTNKPLKVTFSVKLEKEQKTYSFRDEAEGTVKVAEREVFTVEASADGYKPKQSTFNMADFAVDKKYSFNVGLEKSLFDLTIRTTNKITNETITIGNYTITDLTKKTNKTEIVKLLTGDATVSLIPENTYHLEIRADGFEKFEQEITKLSKNELICPLTPIPLESALVISAIDSTSGRVLDAFFKVTPSKKAVLALGKTSQSIPEYKLPLIETDSFTLETFVKGYHIKNENITYLELGKLKKHVVIMSRNFSVLSLKAYDALDNKPIREVFFSLIDVRNNKPVAAMITMPNGECSADLKPGREYLIKARLPGYDDYENRFTASVEDVNKPIKMRLLRKYNLFLYAIDARKKNKVSANFKVYDANKTVIAIGKTDIFHDKMSVILTEKTNYTIEITAPDYRPYDGKITPDSSMKNASIDLGLIKDESKYTFRVVDFQTRKIVEKYTAKLIDVKSRQELTLVKTADEYSSELSPATSYILEIESNGYQKLITKIDENTERKQDIFLTIAVIPKQSTPSSSTINTKELMPNPIGEWFEKIEKGKSIVLNNVYFEQGSFIMQKESSIELDKIVFILINNSQTKIEIGGHTDNIGDQRLNLALSENRAKVILNYLVSKGIQENRLFYKGYGGTKPVAPNDSEENKKKNRRVEIVGIQ